MSRSLHKACHRTFIRLLSDASSLELCQLHAAIRPAPVWCWLGSRRAPSRPNRLRKPGSAPRRRRPAISIRRQRRPVTNCAMRSHFIVRLGLIDGDFIVAAKRCHAFAGPAIAVSSTKAVAVEQARNHIVAAHKCKRAYRLYDFRRRTVALPASAASSCDKGDAEPLALLRKHRRKPQRSMPSTDPEPRGPRAAIRLAPSRNMPLGRTSIPEFPDSGPPRPPSQHIEMSACFPSSSHRGRTHAGQTRGARDKILPVPRSCGRYVVALYNQA
jgi:hypothetical protein